MRKVLQIFTFFSLICSLFFEANLNAFDLGQAALQEAVRSKKLEVYDDSEIVLLMPPEGDAILPDIRNFGDTISDGYCSGITFCNKALLSNLHFLPNKKRQSDEKIRASFLKAASDQKTVDLPGFKNLAEISEYFKDHPDLQKQIARDLQINLEYWNSNLLSSENMKTILTFSQPSKPATEDETKFKDELKKRVGAAKKINQEFRYPAGISKVIKEKINRGNAEPISFYPLENDSEPGDLMAIAPGHAVLVVGYARRKSESIARQLIILDPNIPNSLEVLKVEPGGFFYWNYSACPWNGPRCSDNSEVRLLAADLVPEEKGAPRASPLVAKIFTGEEILRVTEKPKDLNLVLKCRDLRVSDTDRILDAASKPTSQFLRHK